MLFSKRNITMQIQKYYFYFFADEDAYPDTRSRVNRAVLPTAPRAARDPDHIDMSTVPTDPPFTAFLGNLPFDITEEEVEKFFGNLKVNILIKFRRVLQFLD